MLSRFRDHPNRVLLVLPIPYVVLVIIALIVTTCLPDMSQGTLDILGNLFWGALAIYFLLVIYLCGWALAVKGRTSSYLWLLIMPLIGWFVILRLQDRSNRD